MTLNAIKDDINTFVHRQALINICHFQAREKSIRNVLTMRFYRGTQFCRENYSGTFAIGITLSQRRLDPCV